MVRADDSWCECFVLEILERFHLEISKQKMFIIKQL